MVITKKQLMWMWAVAGAMLVFAVVLSLGGLMLPFFKKSKKLPIDMGVEYADQGKFEEAVAEFNRQIAERPSDAAAYNNRGLTYERQGKSAEAMADYSAAIRINPKDASAYNNRAALYADQGDFEQAVEDFTQALAIVHEDGQIYRNRAIIYNQLKAYDKAWADVEQAQKFGVAVDPAFVADLKRAVGK